MEMKIKNRQVNIAPQLFIAQKERKMFVMFQQRERGRFGSAAGHRKKYKTDQWMCVLTQLNAEVHLFKLQQVQNQLTQKAFASSARYTLNNKAD